MGNTYINNAGVNVLEIGDLNFHYLENRQRRFYLGVEIEIDADRPDTSSIEMGDAVCDAISSAGLRVENKHDGSLNRGREIITHPATLDVYKKVKHGFIKAFRWLQANNWIDGNTNAGGHVHIARRVFGKDIVTRDENIKRLIQWVYDNKTEFVKFSQRDSDWARYKPASEFSFQSYRDGTRVYQASKYEAINYLHRNTIEFRIFNGIKMVDNLLANLELVELIVMTLTRKSVRRLEDYTLGQLLEVYKKTHKDAYNHWLSVK
jgi:hypothetical protein